MKKKLLLIISMAAVLMCLLALCVFAETVYVNSEGEQVSAGDSDIAYEFEISDAYQSNGNCRIKYVYLHKTSVTKIVIPEIELTNSKGTVYKMAEYSYVRLSPSWGDTWSVYALDDKETKANSLHAQITEVEIHVPVLPDGAGTAGNFANWTGLEKISFFKKAYEPQDKKGSFYNCTALKEIHFYGENNVLSGNFFQYIKEGGKVVFHEDATGTIKDCAMQSLNGKDCTVYLNELMQPLSADDPRLTWNKNSNGLLKFVLLVKDATGYTDEQMVSYDTIWQAGNNKSATNSKYSASIQTYCTYYGKHSNMQELSSCVAKCLSCNEVAVPSNPVHNMATTVNYVSFAKAGEKVTKCQNADCPLNTAPATETLGALFNCLGYSAKENGVGGISVGFSLNTEAIKVYTSLTGKTLTYGVFAVSKDKLGANEIFDKGGNAASGVISAEILNKTFTVFDIKITGFTDEHKETKLAFGAYVATSDGTSTEYSYMQDDTKGALDGNYYFASYNEITAKTAK